jgi:multimeric flavodoxin WrbA
MKILAINGSPRNNGNSSKIIEIFSKKLTEQKHNFEQIKLDKINITGCKACFSCKTRDKAECSIKDDMNNVLEKLQEADTVIINSPIYMWQVTAQTKLFIDRLMPFLKPDFSSKLNRPKLICIYSQSNPNYEAYNDYFKSMNNLFSFLGFDPLNYWVISGDINNQDVWQNNEIETRINDYTKLINN